MIKIENENENGNGKGKPMIERVVDTIRYNTGGSMPETIDLSHIKIILVAHANLPQETVEGELQRAVDKGTVIYDPERGGYRLPRDNSETTEGRT
jgi:hypothetical protein